MSSYDLKYPTASEVETPTVLKALVGAHRSLAELKGVVKAIPNVNILITTLSLQEAQSSSEIENIITTQDSLYKHRLQPDRLDPVAKEVSHYAEAMITGFQLIQKQGLITTNLVLEVQSLLEGNRAGFRKLPGTVLMNQRTGQVVFQPPSPEKIDGLMQRLEQFINMESVMDSLVRMAVLHHQFETIHPFYDGNGRTGRILNILFLVKEGLMDVPVLYLSRYISQTKNEYYAGLQSVRDEGDWEQWILYMLRGIEVTARHTTSLVLEIEGLLATHKHRIRSSFKFYSQDLLNHLFSHPYTKVAFLETELGVSRATAARYLDALADGGILSKQRLGKENYYVNVALVDVLFNLKPLF